ncbi:DUF3244 domain-containing protein [Bacteroides sp.]|uniref:DUF3244 domain-containing protein n=1 Tax=Bacteroides sp. TaxID=29523 RepID=UPI003AB77D01
MRHTLFLIVLFWVGSIATNAQASINASHPIVLTPNNGNNDGRDIIESQDVEPGGGPRTRSTTFESISAYLDNNAITVTFGESFSTATIIITNTATGETVYSETSNNPINLNIDLSGESYGTYLIEIEADNTHLKGNFSL